MNSVHVLFAYADNADAYAHNMWIEFAYATVFEHIYMIIHTNIHGDYFTLTLLFEKAALPACLYLVLFSQVLAPSITYVMCMHILTKHIFSIS